MKEEIKKNFFEMLTFLLGIIICITALILYASCVGKYQPNETTNKTNQRRDAIRVDSNLDSTTLQDLDTDFWYDMPMIYNAYIPTLRLHSVTAKDYGTGWLPNFNPYTNPVGAINVNATTMEFSIVGYDNTLNYILGPSLFEVSTELMYYATPVVNNVQYFVLPYYDYHELLNYLNTNSGVWNFFEISNLSSSQYGFGAYYYDKIRYFSQQFSSTLYLDPMVIQSSNSTKIYDIPYDEIMQVPGSIQTFNIYGPTYEDIYMDGLGTGQDLGYEDGFSSALGIILENPLEYGFVTEEQANVLIEQAFNRGFAEGQKDPLENVWTIISNAGNAVASVFNIQLLPGITLGTLFGVFIGVPLLIYLLLLLRG